MDSSTTDTDGENRSPISKSKRNRVLPSRYGDTATLSESNSSEQENLNDDSFEDKNYSPEKKRQKTGNVFAEKVHSNALVRIDFNKEFHEIQSSISNGESSSQKEESCSSIVITENDSQNKKNEDGCATERNCESDLSHMQLLIGLQKTSIEILARLSLIEDSLMKNGTLKFVKSEKISLSNDHSVAFMESNNLPLKSIGHIDMFESRLGGEA